MADNNDLQRRVDALENQMNALNNSSTIPYPLFNAFSNRGFLTSTNFVFMGQTTVSAGGDAHIPIPGANKYSMAFANYAVFPNTGVVDAYIEDPGTGIYELHLEGVFAQPINYVVFLNNVVKPDIRT